MGKHQSTLETSEIIQYGPGGYAAYIQQASEVAKEMMYEFEQKEEHYTEKAKENLDADTKLADAIFAAVYDDYGDTSGIKEEDIKGCFLQQYKELLDGR